MLKSTNKLNLGFLISPIIPGLLVSLVFELIILYRYLFPGIYTSEGLQGVLFLILVISTPISYIATMILGWPTYVYLQKIRKQNIATYGLCGGMLGLIVFFVYHICVSFGASAHTSYINLLSKAPIEYGGFILWGIIVAISFWVIARPDRGHVG
jgi:hypothetical protein